MKVLVNRVLNRVLAIALAMLMFVGVFSFGNVAKRTVHAADGDVAQQFVKVTEAPADWSGTYLIVYEAGSRVFDGSLAKFDATSNYQSVTISDSSIAEKDGSAYAFTIAAVEDGYSIQGSSGKYIGNASNSNALTTNASALVNTISLNVDGSVNIVGTGGAYLRYNATSGQTRFRYYKSATYTSQKAIALYKLVNVDTTTKPECEHDWGDGEVTTEAKCTTTGVRTYTCSKCLETKTETIDSTGHSLETKGAQTATCTQIGWNEYKYCSNCNYTENYEEIPMTEHSYVDGVCTVCGVEQPKNGTFTKVTEAPTDWSGTYLIVYEAESLAFDGSLAELDTESNGHSVTLEGETVTCSMAYTFTIAVVDGGYSIQSALGIYLGRSANSNGLDESDDKPAVNTISLNEDGSVNIIGSGGAYLRYNATSRQDRFRYYKSESYTNQEPITLYKLKTVTDEFVATETNRDFAFCYDETGAVAESYLRFSMFIGNDLYNALMAKGDNVLFGIEASCTKDGVTKTNSLFDAAKQPVAVQDGYYFALCFNNLAKYYNCNFTARVFVDIDGVRYYMQATNNNTVATDVTETAANYGDIENAALNGLASV